MVIKEISNPNCKYLIQTPPGRDLPASLSPAMALGVRASHRQLPGYKPTPLVRLERLVRAWGFNDIFVKDEAHRLGRRRRRPTPRGHGEPGHDHGRLSLRGAQPAFLGNFTRYSQRICVL